MSYLGYLFVPLGHGGIIQPSMRLARRAAAGAPGAEGAAADTPHRRSAGDRSRPLRHRRRSAADDGRARHWSAIFCSSRPGAPSPSSACWCGCGHPGDAGSDHHQRVVAGRIADAAVQLRQHAGRGIFRKSAASRGPGRASPAPAAIYLFTRAVVLLGASRAVVFPTLVPPSRCSIGFLALGEVPSVRSSSGWWSSSSASG